MVCVHKLRLAKKDHQYSVLCNIANKWRYQQKYFAFRKWDCQIRKEIIHEFEVEAATKRLELESIITAQNTVQLSHRFRALETVSFIMVEKLEKRTKIRIFNAWKCWTMSSIAEKEKTEKEEEVLLRRKHSLMIASNALFQQHDKFCVTKAFSAWKEWRIENE